MEDGESNIPTSSGGGDTKGSVQRASKCLVCLCPDPCHVEAVNVRGDKKNRTVQDRASSRSGYMIISQSLFE